MGEVAPLRGGFAFKSDNYTQIGIPIIRISNISVNGTIESPFEHYCPIKDDKNYSLSNGAILIAMSGATTGKIAVLRCLPTEKFYQNQRVGYFQKTNLVDYDFLLISLNTPNFIGQLFNVLVTGAQPNVSSKDIDSFSLGFPVEKEEQKKFGYFFSELDNLITLHQRK